MYVWGYQPYFQISINNSAEEIFNNIREDLNPHAWVVGIWNKEMGRDNPNKEDVVIKDTPFDLDLFSRLDDMARDIYNDNMGNMQISNAFAKEKYQKSTNLHSKAEAMKKILNEKYRHQNRIFFVANPVEIRGYLVYVVLELNNEAVSKIPSLTKSISHGFTINRSFFEATVVEFLRSCTEVLKIPDIGEDLNVLRRNGKEFIKCGAENFLNSLLFQFDCQNGLYEAFNLISSQYYEGTEVNGGIIISENGNISLNQMLNFDKPIKLLNHRAVRKILEMTDENVYLLADGKEVYGLGKIKEYDSTLEEVFIVKFKKHFLWELSHANKTLMEVEYRHPKLPKEKINKWTFTDHYLRIFSDISEDDINTIWGTILSASEQKHGTMVVITNNAIEEAERLSSQCLKIRPTYLSSEIMKLVTSIDGAVLMDPKGKCIALGVILDGIATDKGDSSRGARYNSALRYLETQKYKCLIVVISEDGYINLIPNLAPRIPREWIDELISNLYTINESEEIDGKIFNQTMSKIQDINFYLLDEDCNIINKLRKTIEKKMNANIKILYQDFKMNTKMNKTYYL